MTSNTFVFPIIRQDFALKAIGTLREHTPKDHVVIVVDQTHWGYDGAWLFKSMLHSLSDIVIQCPKNYGFAQAANLGASLTRTEYVTICNDDVEFFHSLWWDGVLETFERFDNCIAVNPMSPKEPGWGYGEEGYRMHATLQECRDKPVETVVRLKDRWGGSVVDGFAMWCAVFKRKEWMELGMFDERFRPGGGEDYDALARIYQAGHRAISTPSSWVWHHWGKSKDDADGFDVALPPAYPQWNKLSTKGFGEEGLWHEDCDVWGHNCTRTDPNVARMPL